MRYEKRVSQDADSKKVSTCDRPRYEGREELGPPLSLGALLGRDGPSFEEGLAVEEHVSELVQDDPQRCRVAGASRLEDLGGEHDPEPVAHRPGQGEDRADLEVCADDDVDVDVRPPCDRCAVLAQDPATLCNLSADGEPAGTARASASQASGR